MMKSCQKFGSDPKQIKFTKLSQVGLVQTSPVAAQESKPCPSLVQWLARNPGPIQRLSKKASLSELSSSFSFLQKVCLSFCKQIDNLARGIMTF